MDEHILQAGLRRNQAEILFKTGPWVVDPRENGRCWRPPEEVECPDSPLRQSMQLCVGPHQAEAVSKPPGELSECGDHLLPQLSEQPRRVLPDQDPGGDVGEDPLGAGHHPLVLLGPGPPPRPPPPGGVEHGEAGAGADRPGRLHPGPPEQLGQPALPGLGVGVEEGDAGPVAPQVRVPVPELGPAHVEQWRSAGNLVNQSEESFKSIDQTEVCILPGDTPAQRPRPWELRRSTSFL